MTTIGSKKKSTAATLLLILLLIPAGLLVAGFILFFEGKKPVLTLKEPVTYLGSTGSISFSAMDGESGLRRVRLNISQGDLQRELFLQEFPRSGYTGMIGEASREASVAFQPGQHGFIDGPALLSLTGVDYSCRRFFKGNTVTITHEVIIDTTPPKMGILYSDRYVNSGGSGMVIYRLDDAEAQSGVRINEDFHPGFKVGDGRDDVHVALFAVPYNATAIETAQVIATDRAGNRTSLPFSPNFKATAFKQDRINIDDRFLEAKIPEFQQYYPDMQGSLLERYLFINTEVRDSNNNKIAELCGDPHPERLWQKSLARMPGSSRAGFADHRTYYYDGRPIDQQVHLGIDIASTRQAGIRAAGAGKVIFADYLGIYGNMVLLDHGQGLFSLYSHLSQINVSPGEILDDGAPLGLTGTSGMAGGDHLHFSVLINGVFVTPVEWWDQHWIDVNIEDPLQESRFQ